MSPTKSATGTTAMPMLWSATPNGSTRLSPCINPPYYVDDVGDIPVPLILPRLKKRSGQTTQYLARILPIGEHSAQAIATHGPDAVGDDQPALIGLDRAVTIAYLHGFPSARRSTRTTPNS